jgi:hypothetical protein
MSIKGFADKKNNKNVQNVGICASITHKYILGASRFVVVLPKEETEYLLVGITI